MLNKITFSLFMVINIILKTTTKTIWYGVFFQRVYLLVSYIKNWQSKKRQICKKNCISLQIMYIVYNDFMFIAWLIVHGIKLRNSDSVLSKMFWRKRACVCMAKNSKPIYKSNRFVFKQLHFLLNTLKFQLIFGQFFLVHLCLLRNAF